MIDIQSFDLRKNALRWLLGSSFEPIAIEVGSTLSRGGYSPTTTTLYLSCIAHFSYWCFTENIPVEHADLQAADQFIRGHLPVCQCAPRCCRSRHVMEAALHHWLNVATVLSVIKAELPECPDKIQAELQAFDTYLDEVRVVTTVTRCTRLKHAQLFLWRQFGNDDVMIKTLTPIDITHYMTTYYNGWKPLSMRVLCGSLCCYFRFKSVHGVVTDELIAALPKIANWPMSTLPKALSNVDVDTLLDSFDRNSLSGQRDHAIARCYIDLGLRTAEIARLQLKDIDWRQGVLSVRGKGRRVDVLPLPEKTGQAIACYLKHRSPKTKERSVFLRLRPPFDKPVACDTIRGAVRNAAKRCGLSTRISGPHRFRHTLATRLVQTGASLKDVSDLMRHRNLDTTTIYAKVNLEALSNVASPWPGAQS